MTATITGPVCRIPTSSGPCARSAGHNGDCDAAPVYMPDGPDVWCDWSKTVAGTDTYAGADYCRDCGATDHATVDGAR